MTLKFHHIWLANPGDTDGVRLEMRVLQWLTRHSLVWPPDDARIIDLKTGKTVGLIERHAGANTVRRALSLWVDAGFEIFDSGRVDP